MHRIEPYWNWRNIYIASEDERSPFFGREYSEFEFTDSIYNHYIHPQWDSIDSPTLFIKILFCDYEEGYSIIEMMGEWNDCLYNDIMKLKRGVIDHMLDAGINKFILITENVLNFHASDDSYYEEWFGELEDGWISLINCREHILKELEREEILPFFRTENRLNELAWRTARPIQLFQRVESILHQQLHTPGNRHLEPC